MSIPGENGNILSDHRGATVIEYAILAALVAGVLVAIIALLGDQVRTGLEDFQTEFTARSGSS